MTPAQRKNLKEWIGCLVTINWLLPQDDWHYFILLKVCNRDNTIRLRGADSPDGQEIHQGDEFWVDMSHITSIRKTIRNAHAA